MTFARVGLVVGLVFAATVGCGDSCCADEPLVPEPEVCNVATVCDGTDAFRFGRCLFGGCETDAECCPGTRCRADVNSCVPILLDSEFACEQNADCADPGQRCINTVIGARDPLPTCVYEICSGDVDCGFGRTCYAGHCVVTAPCGGSCPEGNACDLITGRCAPFPGNDLSPGCEVDCGTSALKVFTDPNTMSGESCCPLACECKALPPIVPTRFGRYSRVAFAGDEILVSAYDSQFGDLVLVHFKTDGSFSRVEYLDGIPGAAVVADPLGPRGGVVEPGENVGTHTSIAVDSGNLARIAYHDEDGRSLKVAIEQAGGTFTKYFLDGADADGKVGQFSDIAVAANGTIFVTYLAHNTALAGQPGKATGIKLARSRTPNPTTAADWDLIVLDARPVFDPCGGTCAPGNSCVLNSGAAQCLPEATGCAPACNESESCVNTGPAVACASPSLPPESVELPRARGLYTSVTLDGDDAAVAYYDLVDGDLRVALLSGDLVSTAIVDGDGQNGHRLGDVGRFPTIAKIGGRFTIVYEDFGRHEVRSWTGAATDFGTGGLFSLVDRGQQAGRSGKLFVGAGARLAQGAEAPVAVYQDASNLNLKLASFDGTAWVPGSLLTEGAHGFYSDIVIAGGNAYIVSVEARLDERGLEASRVGLTVQPVP